MPRPSQPWSAQRVRLTVLSAGLIVTAFVLTAAARNLFLAAHRPLGWALASAGAAILIEPVVRWLSRWLRRGLAIVVTMLVVVTFVVGVAAGVVAEVSGQVDRLREALPVAAMELERDEGTGEVARDFRLRDRVEEFVDELGDRVSARSALQDAASSIPVYFLNGILVIFLLGWGPRARDGFLRQLSDDDQRHRVDRILSVSTRLARRYVLAMVAQALVIALLTGSTLWALDVPTPAALGTVVGILSFVPYVGVLFGSIPALILSAGLRPGAVTVLLGAFFLLVQGVSAAFAQDRIHRWTLRIGPAVTVVAGILGFEIYGVGGAVHGALVAIFAVAVLEAATGEEAPASLTVMPTTTPSVP